jgi:hypothetical protein
MLHRDPIFGILDRLAYLVTYARLQIFDWICGPEPPTPADERRLQDRDRLRKAFPGVDIDGQHRS